MNIQHENNLRGGRFFYFQDGKELAGMYYIWNGDKQIIIDHTEVDPSLEGRGVGKMLLASMIEFAREKGLSIYPVCPYARHVMEKTPEYADVLVRRQA